MWVTFRGGSFDGESFDLPEPLQDEEKMGYTHSTLPITYDGEVYKLEREKDGTPIYVFDREYDDTPPRQA